MHACVLNIHILNISFRSQQSTKHQYLYEGGWATPGQELHTQPCVEKAMNSFHTKQNRWEHRLCIVCHELWPTRVCLKDCESTYQCTRCKRDKGEPKQYSVENDMYPGSVPLCLQGLTQVEEMLITRACPIMCIYRKHGGQRGYKGHVVNLPQNIQGFLDTLPSYVNDLPILIVRRQGAANSHADLRVRRGRVLTAIQWLKQNNICYRDITINYNALQRLPQDAVPLDLLVVQEKANQDECNTSVQSEDPTDDFTHDNDSHSFLPFPVREITKDNAIRSIINGDDPLDWPSIGVGAINEFTTPFLATMAFPALFPHATGDPTNPARERHISITDGFKHLVKFGELNEGCDKHWRFASHPRFTYWALNMKQRHQLLSQSSVYLHHHPADANLTVEDLQSMVGSMSAAHLMSRLQRYAAKIQGSSQYWFQRHQELQALLHEKGPPTFFWTVSSADNHWPEMHNLMMHSTTPTTRSMRIQAVINQPHIADWFFTVKLSDFVEQWLYEALGAEWHWYRLEYQARGSTHAHGCAKLKNDPGTCSLVQKAASAWLIQQELQQNDTTPTPEQAQILQCGEEATTLVLQYADWLVTTCNQSIPNEFWSQPEPHPCAISFPQVADINGDYSDLVNSVQRHTQCSAAYCLRKKDNQDEPTCRFKYPHPEQTCSCLSFEKLTDGSIRTTLTTKRNDPRVNSHNRLQLQHWRANVDLQIIVDVQACARYMAKYAAKGEPRSQTVHSLFKSCVDDLSHSSDSHKALKRAMLRAVGERDFSAQETCHMLLSLPLVSCTYNFVTASLDGSKKISKNPESGELLLQASILETYASRDASLSPLNLYQFVANYTTIGGKVRKRSAPVVVRMFPTYPANPQGEKYPKFCRTQLLKYYPWSNSTHHSWQTDCTDENCITSYHRFLETQAAADLVPHFAEELDRAQQYLQQEQDEDDTEPDHQQHQQDDWMQLCSLNSQYAMQTTSDSPAVDWSEYTQSLPQHVVREAPSWIASSRKDTSHSLFIRHLPPVDITTLNYEQTVAFRIVEEHSSQLASNQHPPPLHMVVCGTAGTGKSYLINAIAQYLGDKCILTGTTGMAAFNICGKTLHSTLQLPVRSCGEKDLQGSALQKLQSRFQHKNYVIIDEMSMLGQKTFAWVDKRLRQATGGLSVLLFGDFAQLPPVGDRPLFVRSSINDVTFHGYSIYRMFSTVVILSQSLRQAGADACIQEFREQLLRIRDGVVTHNDWQALLRRSPTEASNSTDFKDAIRLFYDKQSVAKFNNDKLCELDAPIAAINAIHSSAAAAAVKPDDAGGLYPVIFLAHGAQVMLTANLWQEVGLCNGAPGIVRHFIYKDEHPPNLPIAVLVEFDKYCGPQFLDSAPNCVPIVPITFEWESKSRQQLPLQLRYAVTIHKSQGQTLYKAVIDLGKSEISAGSTFVAVSRLRKLEDGLFQPMTFDRLKKIGQSKRFGERKSEEARLQQLWSTTQSCTHHPS